MGRGLPTAEGKRYWGGPGASSPEVLEIKNIGNASSSVLRGVFYIAFLYFRHLISHALAMKKNEFLMMKSIAPSCHVRHLPRLTLQEGFQKSLVEKVP